MTTNRNNNANGKQNDRRLKKTCCVEDAVILNSVTAMAKKYGILPNNLSTACHTGKTIKGKHFVLVEEAPEHLDKILSYTSEMKAELDDLKAKAEAYDKLMARKHFIAQMETELKVTHQSIAEMQEKAKNLEEQIAVLKREEV